MKLTTILFFFLTTSSLWAQTTTELIVKNKIDHIATLAREPMVAEHPNGTLFVSGYRNSSDSPQLWKSQDQGKTWQAVDVGSPEDGAQGNSDVDLYIDQEGTVYLLTMTYTKFPENLVNFDFSTLKGEQITLGISRDEGESWDWQTISQNDYDDRPWITETTNGHLHVIWNDGEGVHHAMSQDRGRSWEQLTDIYPKGGSSFMTSGPSGKLAVRVAPLSASANKLDEGVDLIRLSADNGTTWSDVEVPGSRNWTQNLSGIPRWVEPLAYDEQGQLHLLWSEGSELKLAISGDNGASWQEHTIAQSQDTMYHAYMETVNDKILCSWVSGFGNRIRHHAAVVVVGQQEVETHTIEPQRADIWSRFAVGDYERSTGGEYYPIIPLANGNIGMVTTIQNAKANREGFTWWELLLHEF